MTAMQSSVTQYDVTFTFDKAYEVGQFANGDYWVLGPVTITRITPDFNKLFEIHGWMVNPTSEGRQGFTGNGATYYDSSLVPEIPYTSPSTGITSIVKSVSYIRGSGVFTSNPDGVYLYDAGGGWNTSEHGSTRVVITSGAATGSRYTVSAVSAADSRITLSDSATPYQDGVRAGDSYILLQTRTYLKQITVLTIVTERPPNDGATVFRPPYAGSEKPYYSTTDIKTDRLATAAITNESDDWSSQNNTFKMPQIELGHAGNINQWLKPKDNMGYHTDAFTSYGPLICAYWVEAIAKLNGPGTIQQKMETLIYAIQGGIDVFYGVKTRPIPYTWAGGGHKPGPKLLATFAAYMLDNAAMKAFALEYSWWENIMVRDAVWGYSVSEDRYWRYMAAPPTNMLEQGDPYRFIDGGNALTRTIDSYMIVNNGLIQVTTGLLRTMPGLQAYWSDAAKFMEYGERWYNHGLKALPDPVAPIKWAYIEEMTPGNPTIIKSTGHSVINGDLVRIDRSVSALYRTVNLVSRAATVIDADHFSVPIDTTGKTLTVQTNYYSFTGGPRHSYYTYGENRLWGKNLSNPGSSILDPDLAYYNGPDDWAVRAGKVSGRLNDGRDGMYAAQGQYQRDLALELWLLVMSGEYTGDPPPDEPPDPDPDPEYSKCSIVGSTEIGAGDLQLLVDHIQGRNILSGQGDINSDSVIDIRDVMVLRRVAKGDIVCPLD